MLMEFKRSRITSQKKEPEHEHEREPAAEEKQAGMDDETLKSALFSAIEPELEK